MVEVGKLSSDDVDVLASRGRVLASNHYGERRDVEGRLASTALLRRLLSSLHSLTFLRLCAYPLFVISRAIINRLRLGHAWRS